MNLNELTKDVGVTVLIMGLPGAGKTASIRNMDKESTIILTSEPHGLQTLLQFDWGECRVMAPKTTSEWEEAIASVSVDGARNIVVDTLSSCHDLFMEAYIDEGKKRGKRVDELGLDLYRVTNLRFQALLRVLFQIPKQGKNLIMTCHMKYREDNGAQMKEPALSDNLTNWICRQCTMVLRAERVELGNQTKYMLLSKGACGDYGSDKTGVVKDSEGNDIAAILSRLPSVDTTLIKEVSEEKSQHVEKEKTFQNKRHPSRTKRFAYDAFMKMAAERAPTLSQKEVREWLEKEAECKLPLITVDKFKTLTKKFQKQYACPF